MELQQALAATEDTVAALTQQLEAARFLMFYFLQQCSWGLLTISFLFLFLFFQNFINTHWGHLPLLSVPTVVCRRWDSNPESLALVNQWPGTLINGANAPIRT